MKNTQTLSTISTVDAICASLESDIYSLYYGPGQKLTEKELSERYGVSRNAVREAITFLVTKGLLVKVINKGVYVRKIQADDMREVFHLREVLECEAIKALVASPDRAKLLVPLLDAVYAPLPASWSETLLADLDFHSLLVRSSGNARLERLFDCILAEVKLCIYQSYKYASRDFFLITEFNTAQHKNILSAISDGRLDLALFYMSDHISTAVVRYSEYFKNDPAK